MCPRSGILQALLGDAAQRIIMCGCLGRHGASLPVPEQVTQRRRKELLVVRVESLDVH